MRPSDTPRGDSFPLTRVPENPILQVQEEIKDMAKKIRKFQGFWIYQDENGFFWENGSKGGGYFDNIEDAQADIEGFNQEAAQ